MTVPTRTTPATTLRRAYKVIDELQRRLDEAERQRSEPIAVVGVGCRFPGGVVDPDSYWRLLSQGTDAICEIPDDRWDREAFYHPETGTPGMMNTRWGGFLDRVDLFDHSFFGISRREAVSMDPQQRLVLETAWEALEHAGQAPDKLAGSRSGVFLGVCSNDYASLHFSRPLDASAYASTGNAHSVVSGRLSYALDLRGPSVSVDTACSSSLVAVHSACQSLRDGECDLALSGGVNVILSPLPSIAFSQFGMLATDGRCRTFDAAASGFVRGEGCGIVVLKRLSDALRDGDPVLAVLRGSAINQDGRSSGLTAPNMLAQRDLLRQALRASGVDAGKVSYIEAHGTGTPLGDPIEVEALTEVYGDGSQQRCYLGSVKTNIGHLEAAAGIAGLIKVVLSLHHRAIPPHVNFTNLNPYITFEGTRFVVPTALESWQPDTGRIAAVSSFGFSGTNAHVIVEEGPRAAPRPPVAQRSCSVLALSAKSERALVELARRYRDRLRDDESTPIADLCFSANTGRSHFHHRLAVVGASAGQIESQLDDVVERRSGLAPAVDDSANTDVVFLFTGQGAQRAGMAHSLYQTHPTFRDALNRCDEILRPLLDTDLRSVIGLSGPEAGRLDQTAFTQPALFALEYALAQMWRSLGVRPAAVLGHSLGEYVAAVVAGVMSLEDGLTLVAERARLMQGLPEAGAMAVIFADEQQVVDAICHLPASLSIAAVNTPANTVISGARDAVHSVCEAFAARGIRSARLKVSHAFHSPLVDPVLEPLRQVVNKITFAPPRLPLVSNVTGALWPWDETPDAAYWCRHAREPVRFATGVETLHSLGYQRFVELGPTPTLLGMVRQCVPRDQRTLLLPTLRSGRDDWQVLMSSVATLYRHGTDIDWQGLDRDHARTRIPVPTYPFQRRRCWYESPHGGPVPPVAAAGPAPAPEAEEGIPDDELLYQVEWQPANESAASERSPSDPDQVWLVLADADGVGDALASLLAARGLRYVLVEPGPEYKFGGDHATVRVDDRDDLVRLVSEAAGADRSVQVVHLWALRGGTAGGDSADSLLGAQQCGLLGAVRIVQALSIVEAGVPARLWLVTRGATRPVGDTAEPLAVAQSTLWGLGRSLQREHSALWGGMIDLDPQGTPEQSASMLLAQCLRRDGEDQVSVRGGQCYVARLARVPVGAQPARAAGWRPDASYLITGGLGDLGLAVARSMVGQGARRLVLVGRTSLPPRDAWADLPADDPAAPRVTAVRELESLGASVIVEQVDVAEEASLRAFLERFRNQGWPLIRGVVHAAGVVEPGPVIDMEPADLQRHLRTKLAGAWLLHQMLTDPLDFFVLFSSASAILSSPFIAGYAAANAFLDALAQQRHHEGKPALSINWGYWAEIGIAARQAEVAPVGGHGMNALPPDQALRIFHRLLREDRAGVAVLPIDWPEWRRSHRHAADDRFLSGLLAADECAPAGRVNGHPGGLLTRQALLDLPPAERPTVLASQLLAGALAALDLEMPEFGVDQPLFNLGLDSLMALELKNQIEAQLGVALPIAAFLDGASARRLADAILVRICEPHNGDQGSGGQAEIRRLARAESSAEKLLAEIDQLSDEQVRVALGSGV